MSGNWWSDSSGEDVTENVEKEYDAGGGSFDIIPEKTRALAAISSAAWSKDNDGNRYVNIQWSITKPEAYANRRVFQKIWCGDDDPRAKDPAKKRDKALRMLATIDANAGGKLAKNGKEPDDDDLALALTNKILGITIMVWEMDGKEGNWISGVAGKSGFECTVPPKAAPKPSTGNGGPQTRRTADDDDLDRDVPFMSANSIW